MERAQPGWPPRGRENGIQVALLRFSQIRNVHLRGAFGDAGSYLGGMANLLRA